jgi:hypothetical protein
MHVGDPNIKGCNFFLMMYELCELCIIWVMCNLNLYHLLVLERFIEKITSISSGLNDLTPLTIPIGISSFWDETQL